MQLKNSMKQILWDDESKYTRINRVVAAMGVVVPGAQDLDQEDIPIQDHDHVIDRRLRDLGLGHQ